MSFLTSFRVPKVDEIRLAVRGALQYETTNGMNGSMVPSMSFSSPKGGGFEYLNLRHLGAI